mgnify:CR=1 FL=1
MIKGQINIISLLTTGVAIAIASIGSFFYQNNRVGVVETRTAVLEVRYEDIDKKLNKIVDSQERLGEKLNMIIFEKRLGGFASSSINGYR